MRAALLVALFVAPALTSAAAHAQVDAFDGSWVADPETSPLIARLDIRSTSVRAFIRCGAEVCDIGAVEGIPYNEGAGNEAARERFRRLRRAGVVSPVELLAEFDTSFRSIAVFVSVPEGRGLGRTLRVDIYTREAGADFGVRERVRFSPRTIAMAGPGLNVLPQLPLPLPRPSIRKVLPPGLATTGAGDSLGAVYDRLQRALQRAEIPSWSVYGIGDDGFAVLGQAERIHDDGRAAEPDRRWPETLAGIDPPGPARGFADYLRRLFAGSPPGRYRLLVLAVSDRVLDVDVRPPDPAFMDSLLVTGAAHLPAAMRSKVLGPDGRCEVFIYEFVRPAPDDGARPVPQSAITVERHLAGAGLWPLAELRR